MAATVAHCQRLALRLSSLKRDQPEQLPPGVLDDLRRKNPVDPVTKRGRTQHYYWLIEDVGNRRSKIASVLSDDSAS
jgi:hypothetical protein